MQQSIYVNKNKSLSLLLEEKFGFLVFSTVFVLWTWEFFEHCLRTICYRGQMSKKNYIKQTYCRYEIVHLCDRNSSLFTCGIRNVQLSKPISSFFTFDPGHIWTHLVTERVTNESFPMIIILSKHISHYKTVYSRDENRMLFASITWKFVILNFLIQIYVFEVGNFWT